MTNEFDNPDFDKRTYLLKKESDTILGSLDAGDQIIHIAKQRKISVDVISPSVIITTLKKVVIINRTMAGLKSHITFIPYQEVERVRIVHGMLVSSILIRMNNAAKDAKSPFERHKGDLEIKALDKKDADIFFVQLNGAINLKPEQSSPAKDSHYHMYGDVNNNLFVAKNFQPAQSVSSGAQLRPTGKQYAKSQMRPIDFVSLHRLGRPEKEEGVALPKGASQKQQVKLPIPTPAQQGSQKTSQNTDTDRFQVLKKKPKGEQSVNIGEDKILNIGDKVVAVRLMPSGPQSGLEEQQSKTNGV
jgi:hypothetical protein